MFVVVEEMIKSDRGRLLSDITMLLLTIRISSNASLSLYNLAPLITLLLRVSTVLFAVIIAIVSIGWIYGILRRLHRNHKHSTNLCSDNEYRCIVLVVTYNLFMLCYVVIRYLTDTWQLGSSNEVSLVSLSILQIFFIVIVTGNHNSFS